MNPTKSILLAGSTGYLGKHLLNQLLSRPYQVRAIARNKNKLKDYHQDNLQVMEAELTEPKSLEGVCAGIHTIISTVGITRQKDGLSYMDVDYKANLNLLEEAKRAGVEHFVYVSAINGDKYRHLKIFEAKEKFVDALVSSGLNYTIVRPNGFFSDMRDFLEMAHSGNVFLFGNGEQKFNPIAGEDLAEAMVQQLENPVPAFSIGGPDVFEPE
ncbi:MAG: SDR family oxidoreductase [Saprospiraceae bacterium]